MAKIVKLHPENQSADDSKKKIIDCFNNDNFTPEIHRQLEELGITKPEELFTMMKVFGIDEKKVFELANSGRDIDDVDYSDVQFDEDDPGGDLFRNWTVSLEEDEDEDEDDNEDDEEFADQSLWGGVPKGLFLDTSEVKELHIRIKLNNAPVKIWRELKVPSNMSLELLAKVLIMAMGWGDCHLHQFAQYKGKGYIYFKSTQDIKEEKTLFSAFFTRSYNADETPIGAVLSEKGKRIRFEYDFGDSWEHDVWVKGLRDYNPGETPKVTFVKGQGQCPPEDCGGVWGYEELLELCKKKRKSAEDRERLEWYGIDPKYFDPDYFDAEEFSCEIEAYMEEVEDVIEKRKKESSKKM